MEVPSGFGCEATRNATEGMRRSLSDCQLIDDETTFDFDPFQMISAPRTITPSIRLFASVSDASTAGVQSRCHK